MPELVIQHIDSQLAERIKSRAKERRWSINDVVLNALRQGLGMSAAGQVAEAMLDADGLVLAGQWDHGERAVFQEAMQALSQAPASSLAFAGEG